MLMHNSGSYKVVDDDDSTISDLDTYQGDWKIRFLTSGTFKITALNGAENGIDVFLVGGGANGGANIWYSDESSYTPGGGGGSGKTKTKKAVSVAVGTSYNIVIGAGGSTGGSSSAFGVSVSGGSKPTDKTKYGTTGGNGGSGGGGSGAAGGKNGANGGDGNNEYSGGGSGQGTTTREFGSSSGKLYATGGSGGKTNNTKTANTGNGGDGATSSSSSTPTSGASGIVIIRNKR